jgi:hypothetical protein
MELLNSGGAWFTAFQYAYCFIPWYQAMKDGLPSGPQVPPGEPPLPAWMNPPEAVPAPRPGAPAQRSGRSGGAARWGPAPRWSRGGGRSRFF